MRVHLFGASGSGCSSLGRLLAEDLSVPFVDADDFYWEKTSPPFTSRTDHERRNSNLLVTLASTDKWILAGSISSWDLTLAPLLSLAVFIQVPVDIRMARLMARETERYGSRAAAGGDLYMSSQRFLDWSRNYDSGGYPGRTLGEHSRWFQALDCKKINYTNLLDIRQSADILRSAVEKSFGGISAFPAAEANLAK